MPRGKHVRFVDSDRDYVTRAAAVASRLALKPEAKLHHDSRDFSEVHSLAYF